MKDWITYACEKCSRLVRFQRSALVGRATAFDCNGLGLRCPFHDGNYFLNPVESEEDDTPADDDTELFRGPPHVVQVSNFEKGQGHLRLTWEVSLEPGASCVCNWVSQCVWKPSDITLKPLIDSHAVVLRSLKANGEEQLAAPSIPLSVFTGGPGLELAIPPLKPGQAVELEVLNMSASLQTFHLRLFGRAFA